MRKNAGPFDSSKVMAGGVLFGVGMILGIKGRTLLEERRLKDSVVLITGGSRGLGFVMARKFLSMGCRVAICSRDRGALTEAENRLGQACGRPEDVTSIVCDVRNKTECVEMFDEIENRLGHVGILVNNAGVIDVGSVPEPRRQDFINAMDVHFWGTLNCTEAALPHFARRKGGRIVNITSIGGVVPVPHLLPYTCSKFAAVGLSKGLSIELAQEGISVTTVIPGLMRTGSFFNSYFHKPADKEYALFSLAASLPLISMKAERAASKIIRAALRREPQVVIGMPARAAIAFTNIAPNLSLRMFRLIDRMLPRGSRLPEGGSMPIRGERIDPKMRNSAVFRTATILGRKSAEENQPIQWRNKAS